MPRRARNAIIWLRTLLGLGLLAWLLSTQVLWLDRIGLSNGTTLEGEIVESRPDGVITVIDENAPPESNERSIAITPHGIASRDYGGRSVPDISYGARSMLRRLQASVTPLALILLALVLLNTVAGLRWWLLLRATDLHTPLSRAVRLSFVGRFFDVATPGTTRGDSVMAWYAAQDTGLATRAVLSVIFDRSIGFLSLLLCAGAFLAFVARGAGYDVLRIVVLAVLGCLIAAGIAMSQRSWRMASEATASTPSGPLGRLLSRIQAAARLYRKRRGTVLDALVLALINAAGHSVCCWYLSQALGIEGLSLPAALALVPLANLVAALPLVPGGWGVGELAFAGLLGLVGVPPTEAVMLSVVYRLSMLAVGLIGGALWISWHDRAPRTRVTAEVQAATARIYITDAQG